MEKQDPSETQQWWDIAAITALPEINIGYYNNKIHLRRFSTSGELLFGYEVTLTYFGETEDFIPDVIIPIGYHQNTTPSNDYTLYQRPDHSVVILLAGICLRGTDRQVFLLGFGRVKYS